MCIFLSSDSIDATACCYKSFVFPLWGKKKQNTSLLHMSHPSSSSQLRNAKTSWLHRGPTGGSPWADEGVWASNPPWKNPGAMNRGPITCCSLSASQWQSQAVVGWPWCVQTMPGSVLCYRYIHAGGLIIKPSPRLWLWGPLVPLALLPPKVHGWAKLNPSLTPLSFQHRRGIRGISCDYTGLWGPLVDKHICFLHATCLH